MIRVSFHRQFAAGLFEREVMDQLVHALRGTGEPVVDGGDGIDHLAQDAGLFMHFAHSGLLRGLAFFDMPLRQAPFEMAGAGMTGDNGHAVLVIENQTACRIFAYDRQFLGIQ